MVCIPYPSLTGCRLHAAGAAPKDLRWQRALLADVARRALAGCDAAAWPAAAPAACALAVALDGAPQGALGGRGVLKSWVLCSAASQGGKAAGPRCKGCPVRVATRCSGLASSRGVRLQAGCRAGCHARRVCSAAAAERVARVSDALHARGGARQHRCGVHVWCRGRLEQSRALAMRAGRDVWGPAMEAVLREMLLQAELHGHDPARRRVWLDAAPPLLQVGRPWHAHRPQGATPWCRGRHQG